MLLVHAGSVPLINSVLSNKSIQNLHEMYNATSIMYVLESIKRKIMEHTIMNQFERYLPTKSEALNRRKHTKASYKDPVISNKKKTNLEILLVHSDLLHVVTMVLKMH